MAVLELLRSTDRSSCEAYLEAAKAQLADWLPNSGWGVEEQLNYYTSANVENLWRNELRKGVRKKLIDAGADEGDYSSWLGDSHYLSFELYPKQLFERYRGNAGWRLFVMGLPRAGVILVGMASHYQNAQNHNKLGAVSNLIYDFASSALESAGVGGMYGRKISNRDWDQDGLIVDPVTEIAGVSISPDSLFLKDIRTTTLKKVLASFISVKSLKSNISAEELRGEVRSLLQCAEYLAEHVHPFGGLEEFEALRALALQDLPAAGMRLLLRGKSSTRSTVRIYYGPPGTGKTLAAVKMAVKLVDPAHQEADGFSGTFARFNDMHEQCAFVTFHPSLQYEDFVESIRPVLEGAEDEAGLAGEAGGVARQAGNNLRYRVHEGVFLRMVRRALGNPHKEFVIVIDEINRGDVSRILGPLISSLDSDKRAGAEFPIGIELQYPRAQELESRLFMPSNLHILGTMNSADRNIALVDHALRRRFEFVRVPPEPRLLSRVDGEVSLNCEQILRTINARVEHLLDADHCIGHGYFMGCATVEEVVERVATRVIPLLREYFYGNEGLVLLVLGDSPNNAENFFRATSLDDNFHEAFGMVRDAAASYGYRAQAISRSLELDPRFWNPLRLIPGPDDINYAARCLQKLATAEPQSDPEAGMM